MDQNPQQPNETAPPADVAGPAPVMPPASTQSPYPRTTGGMATQDDKSQAMLMWILTIFFHFIPGLIFFLTAKDKPLTSRQSALALTWAITFVVCYVAVIIVSAILAAVTMGIGALFVLLLFVLWALHLVICIMGAVASNKGEDFNPPVITGLCKSVFKV